MTETKGSMELLLIWIKLRVHTSVTWLVSCSILGHLWKWEKQVEAIIIVGQSESYESISRAWRVGVVGFGLLRPKAIVHPRTL
jgi:hypothetical protein